MYWTKETLFKNERRVISAKMPLTCCLVDVVVDGHAAHGGVSTLVLLDGRLGPAAEVDPVGSKVGLLIIVGPPELLAGVSGPLTEDGGPLVLVGIDLPLVGTELGVHGRGELLEEVPVLGGVTEPVLGTLDINPDKADVDVVVLDVGMEGLGLTSGITARGAREHVGIDVGHTSGPGVGDVLGAVGIDSTGGAEATDDGELVALAVDAGPGGDSEELGHINTLGGSGNTEEESECKESSTHFI